MMSPYFGKNFFEFFFLLLSRIVKFLSFQNINLASDELQLILLCSLGVSCSLLGSFLVLRKMTMFANSLSHTILVGIIISFFISTYCFSSSYKNLLTLDIKLLSYGAFIAAILSYGLTELFHKGFKLQKDAAIGLVFTALFALGVALVSIFARNSHLGAEVIIGNLDALHSSMIPYVTGVTAFNLCVVVLFYRAFVMTSFDPIFSKSFRFVSPLMTGCLIFQTALTAICAFKIVGVFLFLSFLTAPVFSARLFAKSLKKVLALSSLISCGVALVSIALSRHFLSYYGIPISTSGLCSVLLAICFFAFYFVRVLINNRRHKQACKTA